MKLHKPVRARGSIDVKPEFSSGELVRSASTQLAVEMRKIYWHGTVELLEQVHIIMSIFKLCRPCIYKLTLTSISLLFIAEDPVRA
jgi:hypothetical protein